MIRSVLAFTVPMAALGALLMALGCRSKTREVVRARWFKFLFFVLIVHGVAGAALAGRGVLLALGGVLVLAGAWELARARRRMPSGSGWIWLPAAALFGAFLVQCWRLEPPRVLVVFLCTAAFDGMSQVTGQLLGRRPLAPTISPAKTVEGLAGGLAGSVLAALGLRGLASLTAGPAALLGMGLGLASLGGDLAGSWTKRRAGLKDFSGLLPGQGGALDRFNSFLAAPEPSRPLALKTGRGDHSASKHCCAGWTMTMGQHQASRYVRHLLDGHRLPELLDRLRPDPAGAFRHLPGGSLATPDAILKRWAKAACPAAQAVLLDAQALAGAPLAARNIENYVGNVKIPVGLAGPLRVHGLHAHGDYFLPLATTEAALVASYARGAALITAAGGCTALLLAEGVTRSPGFVFRDLLEVSQFLSWALTQEEAFKAVVQGTTHHGELEGYQVSVEGNRVFLLFDYHTGDAAGQNMVTIATEAICAWILVHTPVAPTNWYVEANASGDKKASSQAFASVRGKKVTAEVTLPADLVRRRLHAEPTAIVDYYRMSTMGAILAGTIGTQGHFANGLAALFIACGQDAACVAEAAVGTNRFEVTAEGDLYVTVTLPNLIVGTVGGGTGLPSQRACLELLGLAGPGHARAFAEVCAACVLAGEISIAGAIASGEFTRAHRKLARGKELEGQR